jgi:hypothetical protein
LLKLGAKRPEAKRRRVLTHESIRPTLATSCVPHEIMPLVLVDLQRCLRLSSLRIAFDLRVIAAFSHPAMLPTTKPTSHR